MWNKTKKNVNLKRDNLVALNEIDRLDLFNKYRKQRQNISNIESNTGNDQTSGLQAISG